MASRPAITPGMAIFGSDNALVGRVDQIVGPRILLLRTGVSDADNHYIPIERVARVTDRVTLDCPAAMAKPRSATAGRIIPDKPVVRPLLWTSMAVAAAVLLYGAITMIPRGKPVAMAAMGGSGTVTIGTPAGQGESAGTALVASVEPAAPVEVASPQSIAEFLNSDAAVPQSFSLDDLGFAPKSATLPAGADKVTAGIAEVMTAHGDTRIKLAVLPGGGSLAMRRVMAIRAALIARGIAEYRIVVGVVRNGIRQAKSGIALIVLAR